MLPNQPCIPEKVFQIISTKCFVPRATRASATVLKSNLIEVKGRKLMLKSFPVSVSYANGFKEMFLIEQMFLFMLQFQLS